MPAMCSMYQQDSIYYVLHLHFTEDKQQQASIPYIIGMVLDTFADVFSEPRGLPPYKKYDYTIPLMSGASLVNLCSYRYSPMQKKLRNKSRNC
jgi:hypothetical protein